jgi:uncharacterized membrane protein YhaH (DUF805 family)
MIGLDRSLLALTPVGRLRRRWFLPLVVTTGAAGVGGYGLAFDPVVEAYVGPLAWLSFYPLVCVFSRRLRDMGRSGWWSLLPVALTPAAFGVAISGGLAIGAAILVVAGLLLFALIWLPFLAWLAISPGAAECNTGAAAS